MSFWRSAILLICLLSWPQAGVASQLACNGEEIAVAISGYIAIPKRINTVGPATKPSFADGRNDILRLNMSHSPEPLAGAKLIGAWLRASLGKMVGLLVDLPGPKSRTRNESPVPLERSESVVLFKAGNSRPVSKGKAIPMEPEVFEAAVRVVDSYAVVKFDDGRVVGRVTQVDKGREEVTVRIAEVPANYQLGTKKGVNYPSLNLGLDAVTGQDKRIARMVAFVGGVQVMAISFIGGPKDVAALKNTMGENFNSFEALGEERREFDHANGELGELYGYLNAMAPERYPESASTELREKSVLDHIRQREFEMPLIMGKIESPEAMENLNSIVEAVDLILVARGDLGVEVGIEKLAAVTATIAAAARRGGKPAIVATGMMRSMMEEGAPLSLEDATDIMTQIIDNHADGVMTSEETAVGDQPEAVKAEQADQLLAMGLSARAQQKDSYKGSGDYRRTIPLPTADSDPQASAFVESSNILNSQNNNKGVIFIVGENYEIVRRIAAFRPISPILVASNNRDFLRRLNLTSGVVPIYFEEATETDLIIAARRSREMSEGAEFLVIEGEDILAPPVNF